MNTKIAYLRGLMDGLKLPEDDNKKVLKAIADCLEAIAAEVELQSERCDVLESSMDEINEDIDELDEVLGFLLEEEDDECEDEECDWEDDFDYFTCPECGEIVPLDEEMLHAESDPICPKCNAKLFSE